MASASFACADTITMNTSPLVGNGPFTLDFQFIDGNGAGDGNNTVTLSNFAAGSGSIGSSPSSSAGGIVVNSSPLSVGLTDSSFFNDVQFAFTPGNTLSFNVAATSNADTFGPDTFTFAILDKHGNEIPTTNPNGLNSFLELDLPGPGTGRVVITSGSSDQSSFQLSAPTDQSGVSAVPEPSALPVIGIAAALLFAIRRMRP
jgi:hypothetical protein